MFHFKGWSPPNQPKKIVAWKPPEFLIMVASLGRCAAMLASCATWVRVAQGMDDGWWSLTGAEGVNQQHLRTPGGRVGHQAKYRVYKYPLGSVLKGGMTYPQEFRPWHIVSTGSCVKKTMSPTWPEIKGTVIDLTFNFCLVRKTFQQCPWSV